MTPFLRTDVTAVSLHNNYILAGIGGTVHIFNKTTHILITQISVLARSKVHGFTWSAEDTVVAYGGKQIVIISVTATNDESGKITTKIISKFDCDDWILHTLWTETDTLAVLTAHSVVQTWSTSRGIQLSSHPSERSSILYSGLLAALEGDVLVLAGTVYSSVLLRRCGGQHTQILRGHEGVIFCIQWDEEKEVIVTTSDDRSVRVWGPTSQNLFKTRQTQYWDTCIIACRFTLYGHTSRVMRCSIAPKVIVSVGEDSHICLWNLSGKLSRRVRPHHGSIWSVDCDATHVVTGASDCGIVLHPLTLAIDNSNTVHIAEGSDVPKRILFTARGNLAVYQANDALKYLEVAKNHWSDVSSYSSSYKMIALSSCNQMLAVIDVDGNLDVFTENCKGDATLKKFLSTQINVGSVKSLHWAGNRLLVICADGGRVTVAGFDCPELYSFSLPPCKERWLTAAAVSDSLDMFVFGDRCGNVHFYRKDTENPVRTFRRVHGRYGATTITWRDRSVVTTGRDGTVRYFSVNNSAVNAEVKAMHCEKLPFQWVERILDDRGPLVCGFSERNFIVYNVKDGRSAVDFACGGGHRAWDVRRYFSKVDDSIEEFVKFVYYKDSSLHDTTFQMSMMKSFNIVDGTHFKEINCLKMITVCGDILYVAGGEDTTVRVSKYSSHCSRFTDELIFKQVSSTRSLACCRLGDNEFLLVSGGGRANVCVKVIKYAQNRVDGSVKLEAENVVDYQVMGSDADRRNANVAMDPETRIMSLDLVQAEDTYIVAGCSDGLLRIFKYDHVLRSFKPSGEIDHHRTCVLIVRYFESAGRRMVFSATTTGEVAVWDAFSLLRIGEGHLSDARPVLEFTVNRSGINSLCARTVDDGWVLAMGGDDSAVTVMLLGWEGRDGLSSMREVSRWSTSSWHGAQVTGLQFVRDSIVSASIDQRVTVGRVEIKNGLVSCVFVGQRYTHVADVHGLEVGFSDGDAVVVCVYGRGIETIDLDVARSDLGVARSDLSVARSDLSVARSDSNVATPDLSVAR